MRGSQKRKFQGKARLYCVCRGPDDHSLMIECSACKEWFHGRCVGVQSRSDCKGKQWYCPKCHNLIHQQPQWQELQDLVNEIGQTTLKDISSGVSNLKKDFEELKVFTVKFTEMLNLHRVIVNGMAEIQKPLTPLQEISGGISAIQETLSGIMKVVQTLSSNYSHNNQCGIPSKNCEKEACLEVANRNQSDDQGNGDFVPTLSSSNLNNENQFSIPPSNCVEEACVEIPNLKRSDDQSIESHTARILIENFCINGSKGESTKGSLSDATGKKRHKTKLSLSQQLKNKKLREME